MMRGKSKRGGKKPPKETKPQQQKTWKVLITFCVAASKGGLTLTEQGNVLMHQAISFARKKLPVKKH